MSDFSNINFDLEEEEEYTPTVDFSGIDFDSEPESSIFRESQYGTAQEPMLLGSAASLLTSGIKSIFSDKTFAEEKREAERKRQAGIDIEFPEFAGDWGTCIYPKSDGHSCQCGLMYFKPTVKDIYVDLVGKLKNKFFKGFSTIHHLIT